VASSTFVDPADAFDIDDIMPKEKGVIRPAKPIVYPLTWDDELHQVQKQEWLIDGVLPAEGLSVLHGHPGVGKTFVALDWALSIAQDRPWRWHHVQPGDVVYVSAEGWRGIRDRVAAWKVHNHVLSGERSGVAFLGRALRMLDEQDADLFAESIINAGIRPVLVVIDTLARNAVGIDENSARDMGRVVSYADRLRERLGAAVLLVHHSRKNQEGRPVMRGSSALNGAADMVAQVDKDGDDDARLVLVCDKMKDGPPFQRASLLLQPVENSVVIADAPGKQKPVKQVSLLDDFPEEASREEPGLVAG
jgi:hypothetical protein